MDPLIEAELENLNELRDAYLSLGKYDEYIDKLSISRTGDMLRVIYNLRRHNFVTDKVYALDDDDQYRSLIIDIIAGCMADIHCRCLSDRYIEHSFVDKLSEYSDKIAKVLSWMDRYVGDAPSILSLPMTQHTLYNLFHLIVAPVILFTDLDSYDVGTSQWGWDTTTLDAFKALIEIIQPKYVFIQVSSTTSLETLMEEFEKIRKQLNISDDIHPVDKSEASIVRKCYSKNWLRPSFRMMLDNKDNDQGRYSMHVDLMETIK